MDLMYSSTVVQWYSGTVVEMGLIYMDGTQADHAGSLHSAVVGVECTCLTFLHRVFSNESSNGLPERMHSHIGCICLTFLHCVFSN